MEIRVLNNDITLVYLTCVKCGAKHTLCLGTNEVTRLMDGHEHIQDILPDLSPKMREMFISGFCPKCWDALFSDEEEGELDEDFEMGFDPYEGSYTYDC